MAMAKGVERMRMTTGCDGTGGRRRRQGMDMDEDADMDVNVDVDMEMNRGRRQVINNSIYRQLSANNEKLNKRRQTSRSRGNPIPFNCSLA